jgi:dihydroorotate dehydrogenase electron transfer subunit
VNSASLLHRRPVQIRAQVRTHFEVAPGYRRLGLDTADAFVGARPGQFVMLGLGPAGPRLLRRPFSIHRRIAGGIELLYRVVGPTTRAMAVLLPGAVVDLLGPLGRGFTVPAGLRRLALTAGGIGVAPMVFLAETLVARQDAPGAIDVYLGGRSRQDLLCRGDFERLGLPVTVTTDDGSAGDRCLVTVPLASATAVSPPELICACGPPAMLRCVAQMAMARRIACQVSIETLMACGMGACLGCAVAGSDPGAPYLHVCRDGPVFDAADLDWAPSDAVQAG